MRFGGGGGGECRCGHGGSDEDLQAKPFEAAEQAVLSRQWISAIEAAAAEFAVVMAFLIPDLAARRRNSAVR